MTTIVRHWTGNDFPGLRGALGRQWVVHCCCIALVLDQVADQGHVLEVGMLFHAELERHGDFLEWKYIDGLSIIEIAGRLDIGTEAVQSQLARAKRNFKRAFT